MPSIFIFKLQCIYQLLSFSSYIWPQEGAAHSENVLIISKLDVLRIGLHWWISVQEVESVYVPFTSYNLSSSLHQFSLRDAARRNIKHSKAVTGESCHRPMPQWPCLLFYLNWVNGFTASEYTLSGILINFSLGDWKVSKMFGGFFGMLRKKKEVSLHFVLILYFRW